MSIRISEPTLPPSSGRVTPEGDRELRGAILRTLQEHADAIRSLDTSGGDVDLTGYATQAWVLSQGYLTASDLTGYATEAWVLSQGYLTASDLTGYALTSYVDAQIATRQPLDADLTAIAALTGDGLLRKTTGVWGMDTASYSLVGHTHVQADITDWPLTVARGGTGQTSWTTFGVLYSPDGSSLSDLGTPGVSNVLRSDGTGIPGWGKLTSTYTTGTFPADAHTLDSHTGNLSVSRITSGPDDTYLVTRAGTVQWGAIAAADIPAHDIITAHTASGLTAGHVLRATGATTFAFGALQSGDLPAHNHDASHVTTGVFDAARLGLSLAYQIPYTPDGSGLSAIAAPATNDVLIAPTGIPAWGKVTSSMTTGTFPADAHTLDSHTGNLSVTRIEAGPADSFLLTRGTTVQWGAIAASDLPPHDLITSHTASGLTAGHVLRATGAAAFSFGAIQLSDLPTITVAKGGTGLTTITSGGILYGNGTGNVNVTAAPGALGALLYGQDATSWNVLPPNLTGGTNKVLQIDGTTGSLSWVVNTANQADTLFNGSTYESGSYYLSRANHTGTQAVTTLSGAAPTALIRSTTDGTAWEVYNGGALGQPLVVVSGVTNDVWAAGSVNVGSYATGQLPLANGGTGANLTDPNADRILFWDDSLGAMTWLTVGSGLAITGTTLATTGGGGSDYYASMTDGTVTASASGSDTFKFRSANNAISVLVGSNDATHGDNLLLTFNEANITITKSQVSDFGSYFPLSTLTQYGLVYAASSGTLTSTTAPLSGSVGYSPDGTSWNVTGASAANQVLRSTGAGLVGWGTITSAYTTGTFPPSSHTLDSHTGTLSVTNITSGPAGTFLGMTGTTVEWQSIVAADISDFNTAVDARLDTAQTITGAWNFTGGLQISGANVATESWVSTNYQPLDGDLTSIAGLAGTSGLLRKTAANTWSLDTETYATQTWVAAGYQPLDADLTSIAALGFTATAFLKKTAANTWALDTNVYATEAWVTSQGYLDASDLLGYATESWVAAGYQPLDADLTSIAGLAGTSGLLRKTAANTWSLDTNTYLTSADLISYATISYVDGEIATRQPLDADLTSIAGLGFTSTAFLKKTAANTWALDTNTYLTGNQTITLSGDVTGSGTTAITTALSTTGVGAGTYRSVTVDTKGRVTAGTNPTTISGYGITDFETYLEGLSGPLALSARVGLNVGSAASPQLYYNSGTTTGLYFGTNEVNVSIAGVQHVRIDPAGLGLVNAQIYQTQGLYVAGTGSTGTLQISWNGGNSQKVTVGAGSLTIVIDQTTMQKGSSYAMQVYNGSGAARTVSWSGVDSWVGGTSPTASITNGNMTVVQFYCAEDAATGRYIIGSVILDNTAVPA